MKLPLHGSAGVRTVTVIAIGGILATAGIVRWLKTPEPPVAIIRRGPLVASVTVSGKLRPLQSVTYRSPLQGRDAEIIEIVTEGSMVTPGDLLVRLDTTDLERDVQRMQQEIRQLHLDVQVATGEQEEAAAHLKNVSEGEGALSVEEARTRLQLAEKKAGRFREERQQLTPLLEKGFITREELARTSDQLELAEEELKLARKRTDVVVRLAHPREKQRAAVQLVQKAAQLEDMRRRELEATVQLQGLHELIAACAIRARTSGLVVYEEFLNASPRRKVRAGDRVAATQGLVTIPEVHRMMLEASVPESQVHRIRSGLEARVRLEASPGLHLTGRVQRVGTLASGSIEAFPEKRFEVVVELDHAGAELRPEMTARADVIVASRDSVLLAPVNALFHQGDALVAYVDGAARVEMRHVQVGEANQTVVEITQGLREGDRVLLSNPAGAAARLGYPAAASLNASPLPSR